MKIAKMTILIVMKESVLTAIIKLEMSAKSANVMKQGQRKILFVTKTLVTAQTTVKMPMKAQSAKSVKVVTICGNMAMIVDANHADHVTEPSLMLTTRANVMMLAIVFVSQTLLAGIVKNAKKLISNKMANASLVIVIRLDQKRTNRAILKENVRVTKKNLAEKNVRVATVRTPMELSQIARTVTVTRRVQKTRSALMEENANVKETM